MCVILPGRLPRAHVVHGTCRLVILVVTLLTGPCCGYTLHKILWTTDDIRFSKEGRPALTTNMGDAVDFLCPKLSAPSEVFSNDIQENVYMRNFTIYKVSESAYKSCNTSDARVMLRCNRPGESRMFTMDIMQYNAIPGSIEFQCEQTNYFVAKEMAAERRPGSLMCQRYNTRLKLHVHCPPPPTTQRVRVQATKNEEDVATNTFHATLAPSFSNELNLLIIISVCAGICILATIGILGMAVSIVKRRKQRSTQKRKDSLKSTITVIRQQHNSESASVVTAETLQYSDLPSQEEPIYYYIDPEEVHRV